LDGGDWAAYVAGPLVTLARECGLSGAGGARILLASHVPEGKGVSSSAAIEVAAFFALAAAANLDVEPHEAALLCQRAENLVVGAPCGVMDPMTSALGRRERMLALLCQPASVQGTPTLPSGIRVCGIDSGVRHAVRGADYGQVRVAAFMGYRILADALGLRVQTTDTPGRVSIDDPQYRGYLANLTPAELDAGLLQCLPPQITGAEFLQRYAGITDSVTRVSPEQSYPVRAATEHPIREHQRVRQFADLLESAREPNAFAALGQLMFASHASYSRCGLGSDATDHLVRLVRDIGPAGGVFGAKITGGGSGGTVAVLADAEADVVVSALCERYSAESGRAAYRFVGSSAGAAEFGTIVMSGDTLVK
jgi:L-arabinokinase